MRPPAPVVQAVRQVWEWQWRQLMGGLGPADAEGNYRRPAAAYGQLPPLPPRAGEAGHHVLIVGRSCPWAHRAWLVWTLRQLDATITLQVVEPDRRGGRWCFTEPFEGCSTLAELYQRRAPGASAAPAHGPATVPCLYSRTEGRILVNESAVLIELLNQWPAPSSACDLAPASHSNLIQEWRERLQHSVNDGVYRCGFARNQAAYDRAEAALFSTLCAADEVLAAAEAKLPPAAGNPGPWLCGGSEPSLADVILFPTLIRLELVYAPLFGCSRLPLWQLPALWRWRQRFYGLAGVAATCWPEHWRADYFGSLFPLHPSGIVPAGPALATLVNGTPAVSCQRIDAES
ncbi:glutathione S-transferase C-terminal domain-containing protein [Synechococcus sp. CBW1002]|uniref:glutathione S-transferase C-terminal domain-containing protein n=1 Tax=Synechococcus sp. CBW1002 TaxID=1353134 RepID=UPI0018CD1148|nr:glutathione S-transferase C-terminal domain-containing protein [Synechococcus sp. CBW1002]QPN60192.1 glutathione S-transferase C-terminal domain-containing protein [Synechococcus sp. CBW1002]